MKTLKIKEKSVVRDYTPSLENIDLEASETSDFDIDLFEKALQHYAYIDSLPHAIDPLASKHFSEAVKACDLLASAFSGKMKATIDYVHFEAKIKPECVFVEFARGEFLGILRWLCATAQNIIFTPLPSDFLRIEIYMPYFVLKGESFCRKRKPSK